MGDLKEGPVHIMLWYKLDIVLKKTSAMIFLQHPLLHFSLRGFIKQLCNNLVSITLQGGRLFPVEKNSGQTFSHPPSNFACYRLKLEQDYKQNTTHFRGERKKTYNSKAEFCRSAAVSSQPVRSKQTY